MRVPVVDPSVRGGGFDAPMPTNYAQKQAEQTGQLIDNALGTAAKIQNDMQVQANQLRVDDASVQAQNIMMRRQQEFMQYKGKDAIQRGDKSLDQEFDELLTKDFEEIGKSLGNDAQRQVWHLQSNDMRRSFGSKVNNYMLGEYKSYNESVQQGKISTGLQMIAQNPDAKSEDYQRGKMAIVNGVASINQGMDADFVKTKTIEALTPAHVSVIDGYLTSGNVQAARDYFAMPDVQNELTVTAKSKLSNVLTVAANEFNGQELGRAAVSALGENASRKAIDAYILEKAGNNPGVIKYARTEANYQAELIKDSKQQAKNSLMEPINTHLGQAKINGSFIDKGQANTLLSKLRLNDTEGYLRASALIDQHNDEIRSERNSAEDRARIATDRAKKNGAKGDDASVAAWYELKINPSALRVIDLKKMLNSGVLGEKHFNDLVGDQAALRNKKISDNSILDDKAAVDLVLKGANIKTSGENANYAQLGKFYERFSQRAKETQAVTQEQKISIARELLAETVRERPLWFDTTQKVFMVDVPVSDREQIINALRKANKPVTEQNIVETYRLANENK